MGIWGLVGGGVYRGDYEAGKNNARFCIVLFVAVAESGNGGRHRYLTYSTLPPNPFMPLHLTHTMRSQAHMTRRYTTMLSDSAINVSNRG